MLCNFFSVSNVTRGGGGGAITGIGGVDDVNTEHGDAVSSTGGDVGGLTAGQHIDPTGAGSGAVLTAPGGRW